MADKENAAPGAAVAPRVTRAAAKRAAAEAEAAVAGTRMRVALGELPSLANALDTRPAKRSKVTKPASRPAKKEVLKPTGVPIPAVPAPPSPPRSDPGTETESEPNSSASSSSPPQSAAVAYPSASAFSSPPRAVPEAGPSASSSSPPCAAATDAQVCPADVSDIYTYLRGLEADPRRRPRSDYIEAVQKDVSANMRAILVDWLVEVAEEYKLVADTLYLAVYYIDRFLSANALGRDKLQLLGVAVMHIAAKYEEISPPNVEDFCYITDNTYTKHELLSMENDVLKLFKFELGNPTIKTFLRRFTRSAHEDKKCSILLFEFLGSYLAELSLLDYGCLRYLPSLLAASAVFLAKLTIDPHRNPWNYKMQKVTGYKVSDMKDCIMSLHSLQLNRKCSSSTAIRDKYKQHKFKCVSALLPPVAIPTSYFEDLAE